jgi:PPM family protein phosphatase
MPSPRPLAAAASSHTGLRRENNEDRYHCDPASGLFIVVDGVGGQAAGEKAADTALAMLRARLERETGAPDERLREAITLANNEVRRLSQLQPEWHGMACVLTAAMIRDSRLVAGHVGDTRLYVFEDGRVQKVTHDHSPVGEREDSGELTEIEAMRHPRRNEIFRDVGSEPHSPGDGQFVEIVDRPFRDDSAILLCSDGLSDLITSPAIAEIAYGRADNPDEVVAQLVDAANREGGKDNVTAVFAAGPRFAERARAFAGAAHQPSAPLDRPAGEMGRRANPPAPPRVFVSRWLAATLGVAAGCALGLVLAFAAVTRWDGLSEWVLQANRPANWARTWTVGFEQGTDFTSIEEALAQARPGDTIDVGPGEYRAPLILRPGIAVVSVKRREAIIRPAVAAEPSAAIVIPDGGARLSGFRIAGNEERPLSIGVRIRGTGAQIDDVEITGAMHAGVLFDEQAAGVVRGSAIHDNPAPAVVVRLGASATLLNNVITANGKKAGKLEPAVELHERCRASLFGNIIAGNGEDQVAGLPPASRADVLRDNIVGVSAPPAPAPPARRPGK